MSDLFTTATQAYKYQSPNLSLFERLFLNQFWEVFVQIYPTWLAPNLITLAGGSCVLGLYAISWLVCPAEPGYWALCGVLLFGYQTLDGTDGKQARRTKSGSALGELMDHGVDAVVTAFAAMAVADATGFGVTSPVSWFCVLGGQTAFFLSNLTLLHKGKQTFMSIDIMELQWVMIVTLVLTGVAGPQLWTHERIPGTELPLRSIVAVGSVTGTVGNIVAYTWSASWPYRLADAEQVPDHVKRKVPGTGVVALLHQIAVIMAYAALGWGNFLMVTAFYAPRRNGDADVRPEILRAFVVCASFAFGDLMDRLLVMRVSHLHLPLFPPCLWWMLAFLVVVGGAQLGPVGAWAVAAGAVVGHQAFFIWVSNKLATALNIRVFRIGGVPKKTQ